MALVAQAMPVALEAMAAAVRSPVVAVAVAALQSTVFHLVLAATVAMVLSESQSGTNYAISRNT